MNGIKNYKKYKNILMDIMAKNCQNLDHKMKKKKVQEYGLDAKKKITKMKNSRNNNKRYYLNNS